MNIFLVYNILQSKPLRHKKKVTPLHGITFLSVNVSCDADFTQLQPRMQPQLVLLGAILHSLYTYQAL